MCLLFNNIRPFIFSSVDDLYFLSAAMHCGPGTLLVSNDRFHDYTCDMDPLLKIQFNRWQKLYQFKLEKFVGESPLFAVCIYLFLDALS